MRQWRVSVRQQLSLLLILSGGIGLAVLAIATYIVNHDYVLNVASGRIETTARLKSAQIAFNLELMQTAANFVTTKALMQQALLRYNNGSDTTSANWQIAQRDLEVTLGNQGVVRNPLVLQVQVFARNDSGPTGNHSVLNATGIGADAIQLPFSSDSGAEVYLGDEGRGYPPSLYPNLTLSHQQIDQTQPPTYAATFEGHVLDRGSTIILGPLLCNATFSLLSLTLPIISNTDAGDIIGYLTAVTDARLIQSVVQDDAGLGQTGQTLLLGAAGSTNTFPAGTLHNASSGNTLVTYEFALNASVRDAHQGHTFGSANLPFPANDYPAVAQAIAEDQREFDDSGYMLRTHNEGGQRVSVGYSIVPTLLVDWIVLVEQARSEVWGPIDHIQTIIIACLFAVFGFMLLISFPVAHMAVLPIRRLRAATEATADDYQQSNGGSDASTDLGCNSGDLAVHEKAQTPKPGLKALILRKKAARNDALSPGRLLDRQEGEGKRFRIPSKVAQRKHWVRDELTALIETFNNMVDELREQYASLDEKVQQRTIELEHSRRAAEAANESKTLFVANVSHELKTPLNAILGMSAVSLDEEDDPQKLKKSLGIIHKSGDILLRTLNDLLMFSTNQVGFQRLTLDEKDFTLRDVETQVMSIFAEVAKARRVNLQVNIEEPMTKGTAVPARFRNSVLRGDVHRVLQILINLVSNSLKFTPEEGSVRVTMHQYREGPHSELLSRVQSAAVSARRQSTVATANFINPYEQASFPTDALGNGTVSRDDTLSVLFAVQDTGPGVAQDMQQRIFEPFVQGDVGLNRRHSGTGLGLSICSQLASLMKGSIALESTLGKGATFTLTVPLKQVMDETGVPKISQESPMSSLRRESRVSTKRISATSRTAQVENARPVVAVVQEPATLPSKDSGQNGDVPLLKPSAEQSQKQPNVTPKPINEAKEKSDGQKDFAKLRILVAEDNKVNQEVIRRMLKLEKVSEITVAEDGQQALDLVRTASPRDCDEASSGDEAKSSQPYDLILMDIQMPNMDGITATKLIRAHGFRGPIVALTAFAEQSNKDECLGCGMDDFMAKPVRRPLLKKMLTQYCSPPSLASADAKTAPVRDQEATPT